MNINDYKDVNGNVLVSETLVSDLIGGLNTHEAKSASESTAGHIRVASLADSLARTNGSRAITPSTLTSVLSCTQGGQVSRSTDFNNVKDAGLYYYNTWGGSGGANYPPEQATGFMLVVQESMALAVAQIVIATSAIFYRSYSGGSWNAWKKVTTT